MSHISHASHISQLSHISAKEVKEISQFQFKKFIFQVFNTICAIVTFAAFGYCLYDLNSIRNGPYGSFVFPITLISIFGSTAVINLIGCLGVLLKSVKIMRFFHFLLWMALGALVVTLLYFLMPMRECRGDFVVRMYRERVADFMMSSLVIICLQFITLLSGVEFTLVLINEYHESELCTVGSFCGVSEETLDG